MSGPERALCAAVKARLKAEPALAAWLGSPVRVHTDVPAQPTYPLVVVGRTQSRPVPADGGGQEHRLTLTCVSRYGGAPEARALTAAVRTTLDDAALAVDGQRLVTLRVTYADVFRGSDGQSVLGVLRLRATYGDVFRASDQKTVLGILRLRAVTEPLN